MAEGGTDIGHCVAETFDNLVKFFGTAAGAYRGREGQNRKTEEWVRLPYGRRLDWRLVYSVETSTLSIFLTRAEVYIGHYMLD